MTWNFDYRPSTSESRVISTGGYDLEIGLLEVGSIVDSGFFVQWYLLKQIAWLCM